MTSTKPLFNVNTSNVTKLNDVNYLMWSLQLHALIDGYELAGYLDGSHPAPSPTVTVDAVVTPNPDYTFWKRQDRLLYSALLGAISPTVQPLVSRAVTAAEVWTTLASIFAKPSRGHVQGIKTQIKVWTKGNMTIDEYDQIEKILEGLPEDYKPVVDQIEGKDVPPTIHDVHERLRNRESRLLAAAAVTPTPFPVSANVVHHRMDNANVTNNNNTNTRNNGRSRNHSQQSCSFNNNNNNWQPSQ
ncbi:PREDICTED: myb-like protein P [Camelina sativa]|uniref:Myb-like protein P n=1 Tax=Camelina sativa TaxID=90675 RepID=A0ABM0WEM0_CAMSA|nr:PREDICTED: myb-like protein P [Camelina sativa]